MLEDTANNCVLAVQLMDMTIVACCYPCMLCTLAKLWSSKVDASAMAHFAMHIYTMSLRHNVQVAVLCCAVLCRNTQSAHFLCV